MTVLRVIALVSGVACVLAMPSQASVLFNFPNFSSTAGLTLVGSTATATTSDGTVLRLTPASGGQAGAAYSTTPVALGSNATFSTTFQFRFTSPGGIDPADGITFVMAANSSGLGTSGGDIGYGGVPNSVAIEFDTFNNGGADGNSSNHVSIDMNGHIIDGSNLSDQNLTNVYGVATCDFGSSTNNASPGCMSNGDLWTVTIGYDGTNLSATMWDQSGAHAEASPFTVYGSVPINIASFLGTNTAFVGFTAGTGAGFENHDIISWQFANTTQLSGGGGNVPEPGTVFLILGGIGGCVLLKRARSRA